MAAKRIEKMLTSSGFNDSFLNPFNLCIKNVKPAILGHKKGLCIVPYPSCCVWKGYKNKGKDIVIAYYT